MKKPLLIIVVLILAAVGAAILKFYSHLPKDAATNQEAATDLADQEKEHSPQEVIEIKFSKTLLVRDEYYSADGGEEKSLNCPVQPGEVAVIQIDSETQGKIVCAHDYMGETRLITNNTSNLETPVTIATDDADAGDIWDSRSLLTRLPDGRLRIDTVSTGSSSDIEAEISGGTPKPVSCETTTVAQVWEPTTKTFLDAPEPYLFSVDDFNPQSVVSADCFDADGKWKGSN